MKLTRRQEEFLRNLLDLYKVQQEPLHYSVLAERIGVSRFTAYDMLRLLEEKGYAQSTYQLAEDKSGPGRSEVVYVPTERAHRMVAEVLGDEREADWEQIKKRILTRLETGTGAAQELAQMMLGLVSSAQSEEVRYCVEVMTVIALRLQEQARGYLLFRFLPEILEPVEDECRASLSLLGGMVLGLLLDDGDDERWGQELTAHVRHYQRLLLEMDAERCRHLAETLQRIFSPIIHENDSPAQ